MQKKIILFDGYCNLCSFWVDFVIKRDKKDIFRFASLQSEKGADILNRLNIKKPFPDTFILSDGDNYFTRSTAALKVLKELNNRTKLLYVLIIVPEILRDFIYDVIAKFRFKIFGRRKSCRVPTVSEMNKFF